MYQSFSPGSIGFSAPYQEAVPLAAKAGFKAYDFPIKNAAELGAQGTLDYLAQYGMFPSHIGLPVDFRADDATYEQQLAELPKYAKLAHDMHVDRCATWILPASDDLPYEENFAFHKNRLTHPARILEEYGVRLGLEFVGPPKLLREKKYPFIHNLDQILELNTAIGTSNMGLLLDVWHWDLAGQTMEDFKKLTNKQIVLVHVNDAPVGIAPEDQEDQVRRLPGETGVLKIMPFLYGLKRLGYDGPVVCEPFSEVLKKAPFERAVFMTKFALDSVMPAMLMG